MAKTTKKRTPKKQRQTSRAPSGSRSALKVQDVRRRNEAMVEEKVACDPNCCELSGVEFAVPNRSPKLPSKLRSISDKRLRQRACEAWRITHELLATLTLWKYFVCFASFRNYIDQSTHEKIAKAYPELVEFRSALESIARQESGDVTADCSVVGHLISTFRDEIERLVKPLHLLGVGIPAFDRPIAESVALFLQALEVPPQVGRPSLFPGQHEKLVGTVGVGVCDLNFAAKFSCLVEDLFPLEHQLVAFVTMLKTSPLIALKAGIDITPTWDAARRTLIVGSTVVKTFKRTAPTQIPILQAFQNDDWGHEVTVSGLNARQVADGIKNLNKEMSPKLISFHGGCGSSVSWQQES